MGKYIIKRLIQMLLALVIVSFGVFMIINLIPGTPAEVLAGTNASEEQLQALNVKFGLDKPLLVRYFIWLKNLCISYREGHWASSHKQCPAAG